LICQTIVRILQAQVVYPIVIDAPYVIYRKLPITVELVLVENFLSRIHREDECRLTEVEQRTQLMSSKAIVAVHLSIVLVLTDRADNDQIANGNGLTVDRSRQAAGLRRRHRIVLKDRCYGWIRRHPNK